MNETLQTIKARRSVRAYMEQQVSAEDLNLILEAATYAPNGMHLETWHFTAILSPTSLPNGGLLWIALAPWRTFSLQPSPSASVPAGLTSWGRPATTPMSALS